MTKFLWLVSIGTLIVPHVAAAGECLHYDLPMVHIEGRVFREPAAIPKSPFLGPPRPEYAWYFEPSRPLCIAAGPKKFGNLAVPQARRFQILPPPKHPDLSSYLGKPVRLTGSFIPTYLPHYHTNLTFLADSVSVQRGR